MVLRFLSRWDTRSTGTNKASHVVDAHAAEVGGATSRVCVRERGGCEEAVCVGALVVQLVESWVYGEVVKPGTGK